jgi:hypothetical protein
VKDAGCRGPLLSIRFLRPTLSSSVGPDRLDHSLQVVASRRKPTFCFFQVDLRLYRSFLNFEH